MTDLTRNKKILPPIFPSSPRGEEFCRWFWSTNESWNGWDWICGTPPKPTAKTRWETQKKFSIQPVELWHRFLDPNEAIGVRFKTDCKYLLIDIDRASPNHPANNPADYMMVIYTLRSIGLVGIVVLQSTWSGGIHLYFPLPTPVNSFKLACRARLALEHQGFKIASGQLEIFPNTKPYAQTGFTLFNAHRLPLQPGSGSCLLDDALQPESESVEDLLRAFKSAASLQDMELLESGLKADYDQFKKRRFKSSENSLTKWQCYLESIKAQGWTGQGQTNQILLHLAAIARVFLRLSGNELVAAVESMAKSAPGYEQYCNHKRDIHQRAKDIAKSAESYYWKLGSEPCREGTYAENFHRESGISKRQQPANNITNFKTCFLASERIKQAVATLQKSSSLPDTTKARMSAIVATAKKSGSGISATTLYKPQNLPLWHPDHYQTAQQGVTALPEAVSPTPEPTTQPEQKLPESAPDGLLHPLPIYEGCDDAAMLGAAPTKPAPSIDLKQQGGDVSVENQSSSIAAPKETAPDPLQKTATTDGAADSVPPAATNTRDPKYTNTLDPELSRRTKIRLIAISKASKAVRIQVLENQISTWQEQKRQETIAKMRFLWQSGEPILMDEVREWALSNPDALPEVLPPDESVLSVGVADEGEYADINADMESKPTAEELERVAYYLEIPEPADFEPPFD